MNLFKRCPFSWYNGSQYLCSEEKCMAWVTVTEGDKSPGYCLVFEGGGDEVAKL